MQSRPTSPSSPSAPRPSSPQPRSATQTNQYLDSHVLVMFIRCLTIAVIAGNVLFMIYILNLGRPSSEIMNDSTSYNDDRIPTGSSGTGIQYLDQMMQETFPVLSSRRGLAAAAATHARQISSPLILLNVAPAADHHRSTPTGTTATSSGNPAHLRVRKSRKHQRRT